MSKGPTSGLDAVRQIRRLLASWLETPSDARQPVAEILRLTEPIEDELRARQSPGSSRKLHQKLGVLRYTVDKTPAGEVLTEHRAEGSSPPFRVARPLYDSVADVLASADGAMRFSEIMEQLSRTVTNPGEFQVRACLRFWGTHSPPLIQRSRSSYRPLAPKTFSSETKKAWNKLARRD